MASRTVLRAFRIDGVVSYSVSRRTPEFGIRLALGAQTTDILRMVMREGFVLAIMGGSHERGDAVCLLDAGAKSDGAGPPEGAAVQTWSRP